MAKHHTTACLLPPSPTSSETREKEKQHKSRKLEIKNKTCLIREGEMERGKKKKKRYKGTHLPPPLCRPMPSQFPSKRWQLLNPLYSLSTVEHDNMQHRLSLCLAGISCLTVSPPNLICTLQSIHWRGEVRNGHCWHCALFSAR